MNPELRYREIPYNYTSLSDREIILRYFDEGTLGLIDRLRAQRITGRSARLIAEVIGDVFMIERNPYVLEDFLEDPGKLRQLRRIHDHRIGTVAAAAKDNPEAIDLVARVREMDRAFFDRVDGFKRIRNECCSHSWGRLPKRISGLTRSPGWRTRPTPPIGGLNTRWPFCSRNRPKNSPGS